MKLFSIYRKYSIHLWYFWIRLQNPTSTIANKIVGDQHLLHAYMYVTDTLNYTMYIVRELILLHMIHVACLSTIFVFI